MIFTGCAPLGLARNVKHAGCEVTAMPRMFALTTTLSLLGSVAMASPTLLQRGTNPNGARMSRYAGQISVRSEPSGTIVVRSPRYIIKNYGPADASAPEGSRTRARSVRVVWDMQLDEMRRQLADGSVEYQ